MLLLLGKREALDCVHRRSRMFLACIFEEHTKTADWSNEWHDKVMKQLPAQIYTLEVTFVSALSCMAVFRENPKAKREKKLKRSKFVHQEIESWVSELCQNCVARKFQVHW